MTEIAILGFGVVGGGVADLLTGQAENVTALAGDALRIKYILDLRDFPDSPFSDRIVHDFSVIEKDPDVRIVVEVMGGSHPAYEYTLRALRAGKHVVTSNKEVVAAYGSEFLSAAREKGVSYRFEAAVGGGIPVIEPILSVLRQNKITEVRGILNGTTNYILTKMFTFGESFSSALADAQAKGYAERNPDADVLGTDACRKIAILAALISGEAVSPAEIPTEGITKIRPSDVRHAAAVGASIKLLGRCRLHGDGRADLLVSPFLIPEDCPLSAVNGVYNAVEVIGEPVGNVLFYGRGAGAGPTASAVVGDLAVILRSGIHTAPADFHPAHEGFLRSPAEFTAKRYVALEKEPSDFSVRFPDAVRLPSEDGEFAFLTDVMSGGDFSAATDGLAPLSVLPMLS